ncbi:MAG: penicillin acylase family protein [Pseudomonadota bacterium]
MHTIKKPLSMRHVFPVFVLAALPLAAAVQAKPPSGLHADIARTSYGVVHIRANDFRSLGFGFAQSYAADNVCMFADSVLTARGERSRFFGPDAAATEPKNGEYGVANHFLKMKNETSDFFYKGYLDPAALKAGHAAARQETRDLIAGYVAGYNRYLATHAAALPAACRGASWVRPITVEDMYLLGAEKVLHASGKAFAADFVRAGRDPAAAAVVALNDQGSPDEAYLKASLAGIEGGQLGSNAVALGRDATAGGRGILYGSPHYPWVSTDRFYQVHMTVPGKYDAMGVSLGGLPLVVIGFNKDLAWTHTVSYASHFSMYKLALDESDKSGTTYLVDGKPEKMSARTVTVERLLPSGTIDRVSKTFYFSKHGAVLVKPEARITWSGSAAYVLFDPNRANTRMMDQWLGIGMASGVEGVRESLASVVGLPWVNTIAADRHGNTLYADASVVPYVTPDSFATCTVRRELAMFDGARSACAPGQDGTAPQGIIAPAHAPSMMRTDFVANSNDNYWVTNPRAPLTGPGPHGYSPLYGTAVAPQSLRTRMGLLQLEEALAEGKKQGLKEVQELAFSNRILLAEIALPELLKGCSQQQDESILAACKVLAAWDKRADNDSRGYLLFRDFWRASASVPNRWAVPFDPARPIDTPRGLSDSAIAALLPILKSTAAKFGQLGIALDARTGDYQHKLVQGARLPMHGGPGQLGAYNVINGFGQTEASGSGTADSGVSYVQVVGFDAKGPVATGMLVYGQSTDPLSQHYADQFPLYSRKQWPALPFTTAQIKADPAYKAYRLSN